MSNQTIVVVDDDPLYLAMIRDFLSDEGYARVVCVQYASAAETIFNVHPGVVLLEIHAVWPTPGLQLLDQLRRDPITAATPLIICTTKLALVEAPAVAQRCEILDKPFQLETLLIRLQVSIGPPERLETMDAMP
jgi:DNA-binding response OmpR family regulator